MKDYLINLKNTHQNIMNLVADIEKSPDNSLTVYTSISAIQSQMICLATELEQRFHLENSRIILFLQKECEICYETVAGHIDVPSFCHHMRSMFDYMEHEYLWSTPTGAYDLSIAAIIKNEDYIIEWVEYHLMVGVQHFYIYDNESTNGLERKLHKYIQDGIVTYIYWPGKYQQMPVYKHAVSHFQYKTKWLAIIDGDEYIVPVEKDRLIPQILDDIDAKCLTLPRNYSVGGVSLQWRTYGTCGHKTKCPGLIFENYRYRAEDDHKYSTHIKTVCNPRVVVDITDPHFVKYIPDYFTVSENCSTINGSTFYDAACKKLRLNHYRSKSEEEFLEKNRRGWPDRDLQLKENALYEANVECSKVYDPIMNRYIDELKKRVAAYEDSNRQILEITNP